MDHKRKGIMFIIMAGFFFSLMSLFIRLSGDLPTMQKAFFRNVVAAVISIVMIIRSEEKLSVKKENYWYLFLRASIGTVALIANFYAVDRLGLADANILNKLSPFFAIVFSYFILNERANKVEWMCVIMAFIGAVFVVKPTGSMRSIYATVGFASGMLAGLAYTYLRKLGQRGERSSVIIFVFSLFSCVATLPFLIFDYHPMTPIQFFFLLLTGAAACGGQICITMAYRYAPAKEISVFDYSQVLFAAVWGFMFLGQIPDYLSIIGYVIIIGSAVFKWYYILNIEDQKEISTT
ncbi:MAG: DMT family transporter [Erysipelotrichaceae bacterium]|nr:DMT family transporter [Erysipelotrichaceae bacterium]